MSSTKLTPTEQAILQALWDTNGGNNAEVAKSAAKARGTTPSSVATVNTHFHRITRKLGVGTRTGAVVAGIRAGLIETGLADG